VLVITVRVNVKSELVHVDEHGNPQDKDCSEFSPFSSRQHLLNPVALDVVGFNTRISVSWS